MSATDLIVKEDGAPGPECLQGKKIAICGYGNQGRAQVRAAAAAAASQSPASRCSADARPRRL